MSEANTRRTHLIEKARLLSQQTVQVVEMIKNPQRFDPRADLNCGHAMLHGTDCSWADFKSLRENGHGVITRETQSLEADPELRQISSLIFNIYHNVG